MVKDVKQNYTIILGAYRVYALFFLLFRHRRAPHHQFRWHDGGLVRREDVGLDAFKEKFCGFFADELTVLVDCGEHRRRKF